MKIKCIILFVAVFCCLSVFAQRGLDPSDPATPSYDDVIGPVKQMTVVYDFPPVSAVCQYDEYKRLVYYEEAFQGVTNTNSFVRQYTDSSVCWDYRFNADRQIMESEYNIAKLDSSGRKIAASYYRSGKLFLKDSIVYDSLGCIIKDFQSYPKDRNLLRLTNTYEYDSLGRLLRQHRCLDDNWLTMTYLPNGNYKMHYETASGANDRTFIVNSQGQLTTIDERHIIYTYFSDFDEYGNWLTSKTKTINGPMGPSVCFIKRKIEYYSPAETDTIYLSAPQLPQFVGGQKAMFQYIADHVIYPLSARKSGIQGRSICQFVVNKSGDLTDIRVVKSSGNNELDQEAVRVIRSMPKWLPGQMSDMPVRVKFTIPVTFKMAELTPQKDSVLVQKDNGFEKSLIDENPAFPGGQPALQQFLANNIRYPIDALIENIGGTVLVEFMINQDGSISDIEVVKSSGNKLLDKEGIRVVKSMPKWLPGKKNGEPVRAKYSLPIQFIPNTSGKVI